MTFCTVGWEAVRYPSQNKVSSRGGKVFGSNKNGLWGLTGFFGGGDSQHRQEVSKEPVQNKSSPVWQYQPSHLCRFLVELQTLRNPSIMHPLVCCSLGLPAAIVAERKEMFLAKTDRGKEVPAKQKDWRNTENFLLIPCSWVFWPAAAESGVRPIRLVFCLQLWCYGQFLHSVPKDKRTSTILNWNTMQRSSFPFACRILSSVQDSFNRRRGIISVQVPNNITQDLPPQWIFQFLKLLPRIKYTTQRDSNMSSV